MPDQYGDVTKQLEKSPNNGTLSSQCRATFEISSGYKTQKKD